MLERIKLFESKNKNNQSSTTSQNRNKSMDTPNKNTKRNNITELYENNTDRKILENSIRSSYRKKSIDINDSIKNSYVRLSLKKKSNEKNNKNMYNISVFSICPKMQIINQQIKKIFKIILQKI